MRLTSTTGSGSKYRRMVEREALLVKRLPTHGCPYHRNIPPEASTRCASTQLPSSEQRNETTPPILSGAPTWPSTRPTGLRKARVGFQPSPSAKGEAGWKMRITTSQSNWSARQLG